MSLNVLIDYYKQVKRSEAAVVQLRDDMMNNMKKTGILAKEIEHKKNELTQLQQKAQALKDELRTEEERSRKIKNTLDRWDLTPGDLEALETQYRQLELKTETAAKEIDVFDAIFKDDKNRSVLTGATILLELRQLNEITLKLNKETGLKKRRFKRKKELQTKKKNLETKLEKTSTAIRQLKETPGPGGEAI